MSVLDGLARYLAGQGLCVYDPTGAAQTSDWSAFVEALPPNPGLVIALYQYGSTESDLRNPWDDLNVQVRVRGDADPRTSRARAQAIYDRLHGLGATLLPDGTWLQLAACTQGGPVALGKDGNDRHEHTINFRIEIDNPTANRPA